MRAWIALSNILNCEYEISLEFSISFKRNSVSFRISAPPPAIIIIMKKENWSKIHQMRWTMEKWNTTLAVLSYEFQAHNISISKSGILLLCRFALRLPVTPFNATIVSRSMRTTRLQMSKSILNLVTLVTIVRQHRCPPAPQYEISEWINISVSHCAANNKRKEWPPPEYEIVVRFLRTVSHLGIIFIAGSLRHLPRQLHTQWLLPTSHTHVRGRTKAYII